MAVVETEDIAYWKKVYNFFLRKSLDLLWRISVREDVRQMRYVPKRMTKYIMKMVIYEQGYCLTLCD